MEQINRLLDIIKNGGLRDKSSAADALGKTGDARAVEPLIALLSDEDSIVQDSAARALGKIGEPAIEPLIALLSYKNPEVRSSAARAFDIIRKR